MPLYWDNFRPVAKTIADEHSSSTFCAVSNVRRNAFILICCIFDHISDVSCVEKKNWLQRNYTTLCWYEILSDIVSKISDIIID